MSIWNEPEITFKQFASYVSNENNKAPLRKIWEKKTKNKVFLSELTGQELSDILVLFQKECIKSLNKECNVNDDELETFSHLLSDWIFENKLSGIPMTDEEDYNKQKTSHIFANNLMFNWISESVLPLKIYIDSKAKHDTSLSQQQIKAKNKHLVDKHPSLAHLFTKGIVNTKHHKFNDYHNVEQQKTDEKYNEKQANAAQNIHQIRASRAMLFFNHSDVGFEVKRKCKIYKDKKLKELLIEVKKGELLGSKRKILKNDNEIIEIIEPIKGYIEAKYVKEFVLDSAQWKFLEHQRTTTWSVEQSLTLRMEKEALLLPHDDDDDDDDDDDESNNENEDEKKLEEISANYKQILKINKRERRACDVLDLWCAAFNLHDIDILAECYSPNVTSKQFVNQELSGRNPVLQCFSQMFSASDDVGLEITNMILKDGLVILEFSTFGNRKERKEDCVENMNNSHLLKSHPTKDGLPQKVIHGVGIFQVNDGEIFNQRLFWDQDQEWFSDMNVIKMPQSSTLSQFLYKNKLSPVLNNPLHQADGDVDIERDNNVIYEMNDEMSEILALRGLNINDFNQYHKNDEKYTKNKQKQLAKLMFWIAIGTMFVFIVPKYLGKRKR